MKNSIASLVILTAVVAPSSFASRWDGFDSPEKMSKGRYSFNLNDLPESGRLSEDKIPWADTYFPTYKGGIAYRWQSKKPSMSWSYKLYSRSELQQMTAEEIAKLSPAEKFDIWQGDYSYPTVKRERGRTSPRAAEWAGLCHGWAPAAINHREPTPKTVRNAHGIEIPFGSSDIKGVLMFYYGKVDWKPISWTGSKCSGLMSGCNGINAATVHLTLTNHIGRLNEGFIMDRDRGREIWNQPFFEYRYSKGGSCHVSSSAKRAGAVKGVMITMKANYSDELDHSQWEPELAVDTVSGQVKGNSKVVTFRYCLELTEDDTIVGGEWYSKVRPGYIWNHNRIHFNHPYWGRVKSLLND